MREPQSAASKAVTPQAVVPAGAARPLPRARALGGHAGLGWLIAAAMVPPGWAFIAHAHRWHLTPSVIVLCLAWLALVGVGLTLVRAANAAIDPVDDDWFAAGGSRDDLDREKRSLVRAIKDIEFDRDTGKIAPPDAQALIAGYRARAIEVIKTLELGAGLDPRARILAELKARAVVDRKSAKATKGKKGKTAAAPGVAPVPDARSAVVEASAADEASAEPPADLPVADLAAADRAAVDLAAADRAAVDLAAPPVAATFAAPPRGESSNPTAASAEEVAS